MKTQIFDRLSGRGGRERESKTSSAKSATGSWQANRELSHYYCNAAVLLNQKKGWAAPPLRPVRMFEGVVRALAGWASLFWLSGVCDMRKRRSTFLADLLPLAQDASVRRNVALVGGYPIQLISKGG